MLLKGETYGHWKLDRRLGKGISGEIWVARGEDNFPVAIKFYTEPNYVTAIRKAVFPDPPLESPAIARVIYSDLKVHVPFVVTEHLAGQNLREILEARTYLPVGSAMAIFLQVVQALEGAQERGFQHWNLRPENIFVDEEERVKITDFHGGDTRKTLIPRMLEGKVSIRNPQRVEALIPYMPPEQRKGVWEGTPSDAWALGVILYEMTTGKLPVELDVAMKYPSRVDHRIPKIVDEICIRCLERQPRARFDDMSELRAMTIAGLAKAGFLVTMEGPPADWVRRLAGGGQPVAGDETRSFSSFIKKFIKKNAEKKEGQRN